MAIRDVLWACPFCREVDSIRPARGREICSSCGARFAAGRRGAVIGRQESAAPLSRTVEQWERQLPDLDEAAAGLPPPTQAVIRRATPPRAVHAEGRLLGWAESFGPRIPATITLEPDSLTIRTRTGAEERWPLHSVVAVQPSSNSIQLRIRSGELVSFAFPGSSIRLWERRVQEAVRRAWATAGKGDITEFHPTIRAR